MFSVREIVIFLAGAEAFHTLLYFFIPYLVQLPLMVGGVELTSTKNIVGLIVNGVITLALLAIARWLKDRSFKT